MNASEVHPLTKWGRRFFYINLVAFVAVTLFAGRVPNRPVRGFGTIILVWAAIALGSAAMMVLGGWLRIRRQLNVSRENLFRLARICPVCGYNLRASVDRCPECGTPISPAE